MTWNTPSTETAGSYGATVEHTATGIQWMISLNDLGALSPGDVEQSFEELVSLVDASPDWTVVGASRGLHQSQTYTP